MGHIRVILGELQGLASNVSLILATHTSPSVLAYHDTSDGPVALKNPHRKQGP